MLIAVQTEFFALQGLSKLVEIVQLLRRRLNPDLEITGVLACLYDSRLRLGREVLAELRTHFPGVLYKRPIAQNVKLAETPSFARTIFEYAPESKGAEDYMAVAREFLERQGVEEHASGRSIEPPVRATAEPAPVAQPEPPTPETPQESPRAVDAEAGAEDPAAIEGPASPSGAHDETAALMLDIAKVLASPRKGPAPAPTGPSEADVLVTAADDPETCAGEAAPSTAAPEEPAADEEEVPEESTQLVEPDAAAIEDADRADEEELETVELIPSAAQEAPAEAPEEGGSEGAVGREAGAGSRADAPAASAGGAELALESPAVAVLVEAEEALSEALEPEPEAAAEATQEASATEETAPEPAAEPTRRRTPVAVAHADRGEEHALLPGRRGFTSDPLG